MRKTRLALAFSLLLALVTGATVAAASEPPYDGFVLSAQYVPGADGTRLAVDIYRPTRAGRVAQGRAPVILMHSRGLRPSGDRARMARTAALALLENGYVVAWMEPRGVGASFGQMRGFVTAQNGADAAAVVEWLADQPWSNGRIGMAGSSNMGFIQTLTAMHRPPHLLAIAPAVANPNIYYQLYVNGTSAMGGAPGTQPRGAAEPPPPAPRPVDTDVDGSLLRAAQAEHEGGFGLPDEWLPHMSRDQVSPRVGYAPGLAGAPIELADDIAASGVRIYQMAGWADSSPGGQLAAYRLWGGRIIVGDWLHGLMAEDEGGPMLRAEHVRWFDHVLRGIDNGMGDAPPVYYQVRNAPAGQQWRYAADWPLQSQRTTRLYLSPRGDSATAVDDGALDRSPPRQDNGVDEYAVVTDIRAFGGAFDRLRRRWDGDMTADVDARGLAYTSAPLPVDMEVTGHPVASLWVSSTATDADVVVWLSEVTADGRSRFVTDGVARASHRRLQAREPFTAMGIPYHRSFAADLQPLTPGEPVELVFDLNPTAHVFRAGSRIRITITGGEASAYQQPPSVDPAIPPTIRIHRDARRPSHVSVPVIPARSTRYVGTADVRLPARRYSGPAELYTSDRRVVLRLGDRWLRCEASRAGRYRCAGSSVALRRSGLDGALRAELAGAGVSFRGEGA